jgi:hypothetical protein
MKRGAKTGSGNHDRRNERLPRHHHIAHLRAVIRQQPVRSDCREELAALLRDETSLFQGSNPTWHG